MISLLSKTPASKLRGTALLRLDFNTEDDWRMEVAVPTIKFLLKTARAVVILSHRGRPGGANKKFSLKKDATHLSRRIGRKVVFLSNFKFTVLRHEINAAKKGSVFLLENLRFLPGEEKNSPKFAAELASLGDFYVNEAFAVSHRVHASVSGITKFLPSYAGLGFEKETVVLCAAMNAPKKPLVVILGGGKAYDKLEVIKYLRNRASDFLIGGVAATTLSYLNNVPIDGSLYDKDKKHQKELKKLLAYRNLILPIDFRKKGNSILDIGEATAEIYADKIMSAKTIIWSGPVGYFEDPPFAKGSLAVARAIQKNKKAFSVVGGGETVAFLRKYKLVKAPTFISTGGGAMLEFLAGKKLPGIEALEKNSPKFGG